MVDLQFVMLLWFILGKQTICLGCATDWLHFPLTDKCYKFFREKLGFYEAEAACVKLGANLVSIHNEETNNFIHGSVTSGHKNFYWIGGLRSEFAIGFLPSVWNNKWNSVISFLSPFVKLDNSDNNTGSFLMIEIM